MGEVGQRCEEKMLALPSGEAEHALHLQHSK
jgi:hypothetical protein